MSWRNYLVSTYGREAKALPIEYSRSLEKLARFKNHIIFSARYKRENIIPTSLRIKPPIQTHQGREIAEKVGRCFLDERLWLANHRVRQLKDDIKWRELGLRRTLTDTDFDQLKRMSEQQAEKVFEQTRQRQRQKFNRWKQSTASNNGQLTKDARKVRWVINLSQHQMTAYERSILEKGLNYAHRGVRRNLLRVGCTPPPPPIPIIVTHQNEIWCWYMYMYCSTVLVHVLVSCAEKILVARTRRTRTRGLWIHASSVRIFF